MASTFATASATQTERRFFLILTSLMSASIVTGFALQLALGRSSFDVPWIYHAHAVVFFGWVALFTAQAYLMDSGNIVVHRQLGMVAVIWVPVMTVLGIALSLTVMQRTGGPFFFAQNQFLFSNPAHLLCFAALTFWALKVRRQGGWHRRLLICGYALLTGPGLGRILPLPFMIPNAWHIMVAVLLVFPVIGMIRDKLKMRRVHPAWYAGIAAILAVQIAADLIADSPWGMALTEYIVAGTPGGERPVEAFLPPGFGM